MLATEVREAAAMVEQSTVQDLAEDVSKGKRGYPARDARVAAAKAFAGTVPKHDKARDV